MPSRLNLIDEVGSILLQEHIWKIFKKGFSMIGQSKILPILDIFSVVGIWLSNAPADLATSRLLHVDLVSLVLHSFTYTESI